MSLSKFSSSDCEFAEKTSKDFDCPICFQVIWNPFLTACCGNHFCETCVKTTKEKSNQCPFCSEKPISGITDKKFQRQINELQIYCMHKRHGCLWVGEFGKLTKHLEEDGECKFVILSCSRSCGKQMFRCKLKEHLTEECPLRECTCEYCGYSSTYKDVTTIHYASCPNYPMDCPNSCSEGRLKRKNLESHLLTCPDEVVSCSFNEIGCKERMKRKCLKEHIEANLMQHHLMMYDAFKTVKKENDALKDDIKILKQKNEELQKNDVVLKSAQGRMDHSTIGFVLKMNEETATHQWKEYFSSLVTVSTNTPNPVSPVIIKWPDYNEVKQVVKNANASSSFGFKKYYYTRPFYTHSNGYKMQLRVYPYGESKAACISVFFHLMHGENDDHLKWPFKGTIAITLLNQLKDSEHFTKILRLVDPLQYRDAVRKPEPNKLRNDNGRGYKEFISLSEVESRTPHRQYLMNDTLYFKINTTVM